jgi:hypothetical protein
MILSCQIREADIRKASRKSFACFLESKKGAKRCVLQMCTFVDFNGCQRGERGPGPAERKEVRAQPELSLTFT